VGKKNAIVRIIVYIAWRKSGAKREEIGETADPPLMDEARARLQLTKGGK